MKEYESAIPAMLDGGVDVLIYAGDADFVCNWMGNQAWTEDMEWSGKDAFNEAETSQFVLSSGKVAGEGKFAKGSEGGGRLSFLRIFEAGHLAPKDQPAATLEMINRFVATGDV